MIITKSSQVACNATQWIIFYICPLITHWVLLAAPQLRLFVYSTITVRHHTYTNNSIRSFFQLVGDLSELYEKQVGTVSATHHPPLSRLFIFYMTPFSLIVKWYLQQWLRLSSRSTSSVSETTSASAHTSSSSGLSQSEILVRPQAVHLPVDDGTTRFYLGYVVSALE